MRGVPLQKHSQRGQVFRDRPRAAVLIAIAVTSLSGAIGAVSTQQNSGTSIFLGVWCVVLAALCLAMARQRVVCLDGQLRLVYPLRSRGVPLQDISLMRMERTPNIFGERVWKPVAILADGRALRLPGLQPFRLIARSHERYPLLPVLASHCRVPMSNEA